MTRELPLATKSLLAALSSLLAILGVVLSIGGFSLAVEVFASALVFLFLLIAIVATVTGFFLRRLPMIWVFVSGILTGLLGSWIILIRIASNI